MVAVVVVILDHLLGWPAGGFVGVDVFFVISGFLITGLLLREHERTGRVSFAGFYARRIRRIVPAALVVLLATVVAARFLFNQSRFAQTFWDALASLLFAGNWRFASTGTDYFQADGPTSPLQHFWSLSVEEQFYFVWPWLMLLIFVLGALSTRWNHQKARIAVAVAVGVISLASFAWSLNESSVNPGWAYFSTFSRAWELGVGALLAAGSPLFARLPNWARPVLGWLGLLGIAASVFLITSELPFPGPWAAAPVLSSALLIAAGTGGPQKYLWPLTNPASRYIGDISYSLYLWHFPVIIFLSSLIGSATWMFYVLAVVLMSTLAVLSYHGIERTVLASRWLRTESPMELQRRKNRRNRRQYATSSRRWQLVGLGVLAVASLSLAFVALTPPRVGPTSSASEIDYSNPYSDETTAPLDPAPEKSEESRIESEIQEAARATAFPAFDPPVDDLAAQRVPQWTENNCLNVTEENEDLCIYGVIGSSKIAVVVGDSIATSWLPAIIGALEPRGYEVRSLTKEKCPVALAKVNLSTDKDDLYTDCFEHQAWVAAEIERLNPDLIVMSESYLSIDRLASKSTGEAAKTESTEAFEAAVSTFPLEARKVALMTPPGSKNLQECFTPVSKPADCLRPMNKSWDVLYTAEKQAGDNLAFDFVDTQPWFCAEELCPSFAGTMAIYADSGHLTGAFSSKLANVLGESFTKLAIE